MSTSGALLLLQKKISYLPRSSSLYLLAVIAMFWLIAPTVYGQAVANASVTGQILDPTGAAVVGAKVKMIETDKGISHDGATDAGGRYTLPNLPVGPYRLEVSAAGFKTFVQSGIVLQVGDNPELNAKLQVGAITENVEVSAGAAMVQAEQTSVSQVINQKSIVELPLNGRQPTQLVLISGASVVAPAGDMSGSKNYFSSGTISVGGGQANGTNYLLDGGDNLDTMTNVNLPFPFPDALQEFSVDTSALPARNGTQPGGLVNIVTKSGTNSYHGDLFEFLRNGDLNARNAFSIAQDTLKRNQFGGTIGGKIIRDKLFFFGGYQGTRIVSVPPNSIAYVPTPLELAGNFSVQASAACQSSGKAKTLINPVTGKQFVGNQIPVSLFDPAALKLTGYLPASANQCGQVTYAIPTIQNEDQGIGRIDWVQSSKHALFGRYFITKYRNPAFFNPTNILVTQNPGLNQGAQSFTLGDTYSISATTLNSFHATFTRRTDVRSAAADQINATDLGVNIYTYVPNDLRVTVNNDFAVGCGTCSPGHFNVNTFQFADDIDVIKGRNHYSFGVDFIRSQNNIVAGYLQNGNFTFNGQGTGDAMADFLTGTIGAFNQSRPQLPSMRESIPALYAQDVIHVTSHLTVSAGLRWEPLLFPQDYFKRGASFSMGNFLAGIHSKVYPNAPAGALYYGDPGLPPGFSKDTLTNFSPRLGVSWDPRGDGRQILRAGAAIMYDSSELYATQRVQSNPPFVNEIDLATSKLNGFSNPWTTGYNYPGGNPFPPSSAFFPQYALWIVLPQQVKPTNLTQWNVSYQRQIGSSWLASVSYLGNKTTHLWTGQELNPALYNPTVCAAIACTTSTTNQRKTLEQINYAQGQYYGNVDQLDDGVNASYNALLASVNKRLGHGITFLANYTWSHCVSDQDFGGDITGPGFMNPSSLAQDRGDCNFDIRHVFNASLVATSPVRGRGFVAHLLGNWQLAPIIRALSGAPLTVVTGTDNSRSGVALDRPNLTGSVDPYASGSGPLQFLTAKAFTANAIGTFGNLGRDTLRAPGQLYVDLALSRIFAIHESVRLEVRGEAFNAINRVNYVASPTTNAGIPAIATGGINLNLSSSSFGRITSAGDPRIFQVAMKLYF